MDAAADKARQRQDVRGCGCPPAATTPLRGEGSGLVRRPFDAPHACGGPRSTPSCRATTASCRASTASSSHGASSCERWRRPRGRRWRTWRTASRGWPQTQTRRGRTSLRLSSASRYVQAAGRGWGRSRASVDTAARRSRPHQAALEKEKKRSTALQRGLERERTALKKREAEVVRKAQEVSGNTDTTPLPSTTSPPL